MNVVPHWIDVRPNLSMGVQPVMVLERPLAHGDYAKGNLFNKAEIARVGHYWVAQSNVVGSGMDTLWTLTRDGQYVRVPVFAYRTPQRAAAAILATGLEIGMAAIDGLRQHTSDRPLAVHLVLGHECTDLAPEDAYRCYVGIAIQTKL